ncbi:hypothetical protein ACQCN2_17895 [Brevibacillus ginsengisoli]|uniref:hypothetical protein n=1 Tax=Brevibacillus ginsengisoli TaxID=363854 RepID=UPI003CF7BA49
MKFYNTKYKTDENGNIIECQIELYVNKEKVDETNLVLGSTYQTNPRSKAKKARRMGVLISFLKDEIGNPVWGLIRFLDTNRTGRVELTKLI